MNKTRFFLKHPDLANAIAQAMDWVGTRPGLYQVLYSVGIPHFVKSQVIPAVSILRCSNPQMKQAFINKYLGGK